MPIITVELVGDEPRDRESSLAQTLAHVIAKALHSAPGQTWVRVRWLRRENYAENATEGGVGGLPVFVTILKRSAPAGAELEAEVSALTQVIAQAVGRPPSLVHVEYAPSAAGRMAFGGRLIQ